VSIWITEVDAPDGDGPTLAVKDIFDTAGVRSTYGSAIFREHVPERTAGAVTLLEQAGYVMVGKANLHEFAWGITSENDHYGWVPNPVADGRVAGGSSGGSAAALAAGLVDAALGSDSGGSIRIPAACCGVVGFKVTFGAVPTDGCWPLAPTYDTAGPMARDVEGCERMMDAMAPGYEPASLDSLGDLQVGLAWLDGAEPLVRARVEEAAGRFPHCRLVDLPLPDGVYTGFAREVVEVHANLFADHADEYGPSVAHKMRTSMKITDLEVQAALQARELYRERVAELMSDLDLILTPTVPMVAPPSGIGDLELRGRMLSLTFAWNATGAPALALPCGPAEDGLPASIQLLGKPYQDGLVLAAGRLLEDAL
jgi:Asp-tRNA(Asn)/Glu-tRNA(Gln) amidotransferase A subunit family amidase